MVDVVAVGVESAANLSDARSQEEHDHTARFVCYHHYIFTISNWTHGHGHICIPACIEHSIRQHFPGNGVFVGFCEN